MNSAETRGFTLSREPGGSTTSVTAGDRVIAASVSRQHRQFSSCRRSAFLLVLYSRSMLFTRRRNTGSAICATCTQTDTALHYLEPSRAPDSHIHLYMDVPRAHGLATAEDSTAETHGTCPNVCSQATPLHVRGILPCKQCSIFPSTGISTEALARHKLQWPHNQGKAS